MNNSQMLAEGATLMNGNLTVDRQLSSGGFGNTYVVHNRLGKVFAMKEFFIKGINQRVDGNVTVSVPDNKATFQSQRAKFEKEAKRLSMITNDHIIQVHDLFYENGTVYYTMDYIDGESLGERLKRTGKPLSEEEVMQILPQLLDALSCVHGQKPALLHLDLKPANIMLDKRGKVYLIDFGSSKHIDSPDGEALSTSTGFTFTQGYAPIELMTGVKNEIGPWTDYYSLGATLYNLLTCKSPKEVNVYEGEDGFGFPKNTSPTMRQLVMSLMQPNRKKRPQTVEEVRAFLCQDQDDDTTVCVEATTPHAKDNGKKAKTQANIPDRKPKRTIRNIIIAAVLAALSIGIVFIVKNQPNADEAPFQTFEVGDVSFKMIRVDSCTFTMGATSEQGSDAYDDEKPAHQLTLSSYYIGETEVTQALWEAVMGSNPSHFKGANRPVEMVSWDDCQEFISKLNSITGKNFRLPTEAEWELAARGGNMSQGYKYSGNDTIDNVAWYWDNSGKETHDVKTKSPNELGIYDMSGNVWEWCQDWKGSYPSEAQTNPTGPSSGSYRVLRGSCWYYGAMSCRVSYRGGDTPVSRQDYYGLRLAL